MYTKVDPKFLMPFVEGKINSLQKEISSYDNGVKQLDDDMRRAKKMLHFCKCMPPSTLISLDYEEWDFISDQ